MTNKSESEGGMKEKEKERALFRETVCSKMLSKDYSIKALNQSPKYNTCKQKLTLHVIVCRYPCYRAVISFIYFFIINNV